MSYITVDDIKSNIASNFELGTYLEETDKEVEDLAETLSVSPDQIYLPLHFKIKRYAIVYTLMRLCQDKAGTNNVDMPESDKYLIQYHMYKRELEELRSKISVEMVTGDVDESRDRAIMTGVIYRS